MGIMCCCYVKKNDDYESLDPKSATVESPSGCHRYGTLESGKTTSARPPETKQYQYPKSPLKQKVSSQSSESEHRSVRRVRIHVSSSDSDESDDDSPPPIRRSAYSSAPANMQSDHVVNATKEHAPVTASPSITIEDEDKDEPPKTIVSGLASVFKADDAEGTRADAEGASAADSSDPDDSTGGHSSISGNQNGSLDSLNGSDKGGKKTRKSKSSVVRKVGSSVKRASRKASKSMQKGMAKMLHPTKGRDSPNEVEGNGEHKGKSSTQASDDEIQYRDESSLAAPASPMSPANLSPGPPSPRSPRPISPAHSPISPGRHRTMSYGHRSPSSPSAHQPLTRMSSDKMQSKYAREKMLEREKQWGKIEAEAQGGQKTSAIGQAMQAAHERGQKLMEVEETTDVMRESAFNFAESARHLKEKKRKSAKY